MANQYTGIIHQPDYATLYQIEKSKNQMLSDMIDELVRVLLKKYEENPDPETRRLLIIHGVIRPGLESPSGDSQGSPATPTVAE